MSIKIEGNLIDTRKIGFHYSCGCYVVAGKKTCPIHGKPIKEQMLYGNERGNVLNEKGQYQNNNLNEGM